MTAIRCLFVIVTVLTLAATCHGTLFEELLQLVFGVEIKERSMSEIITDLLDEIYPKDDMDTKVMKNIFSMYNEDGNNLFDSQYSGVDYLTE